MIDDPLFIQTTNEALHETLIKGKCEPTTSSSTASSESRSTGISLSKYEMEYNWLYMWLYWNGTALKKFICQDNRKTKAFVSWLDITHVAVESTTHESLLWYTREWINRINRGGLFEIKMEHIICFGIV